MLPQPPPSSKSLFWNILRADKAGELESVCTKLCEAPGHLLARGVVCGTEALQLSQETLEGAVKSLARGRKTLDRDVAAYCEEAGVLREGGRPDLAIKYIGRALEASAMCYAMQRFDEKHDLLSKAPVPSTPLKGLVSAHTHEVIRDVCSWMREYAALYQQLVEQVVYRLYNLLLLRKASPPVYDIVRLHLNPVKQRLYRDLQQRQQQQQSTGDRWEVRPRPAPRFRRYIVAHSPPDCLPQPQNQALSHGAEPVIAR